MVGGSLRVLRLLPPLKLVAMILLKVAINTKNQSINLSVDMEILTPWSSKVHPEAQPKGVEISISTDRNVNNEFIHGYSQK